MRRWSGAVQKATRRCCTRGINFMYLQSLFISNVYYGFLIASLTYIYRYNISMIVFIWFVVLLQHCGCTCS